VYLQNRKYALFLVISGILLFQLIALDSSSFAKPSHDAFPDWMKSVVQWWADGKISDADFVNTIQYLMKSKIINLPNLSSDGSGQISFDQVSNDVVIPQWIKTTGKWWTLDKVNEDEFVRGIEYLVEEKIISSPNIVIKKQVGSSGTWRVQSHYGTSGLPSHPIGPSGGGGFTASAPASSQFGSPSSSSIGLAVGGANDIENFRKNIENNYLPLVSDITYEGLFYDYFFDTGKQAECEKLFCPSYSYAISKDPFSEKDEYYLSVGLNSGIKESDFQRKKLNLVVVLDVSGSMGSAFDSYYYDQFGNSIPFDQQKREHFKTKMQVATEAVAGLIDHLTESDRLGIVLFESNSHIAKPLESMADTDRTELKNHILEIFETGGTYMEAGMRTGTSLFDEIDKVDPAEYENRIIFLTDAMPNIGDTSEDGFLGMIKKNSERSIYTTFIGIGVDFNTELVEQITKVRGANYYSVHSSEEFMERMVDEFEYMVTPLVFDLELSLESDGYEIKQVYGSPESNKATGKIMYVNTLFPSKVEDEETRGGIVLLKLEKISDDGVITLKTSFEDRNGNKDSDEVTVFFSDKESDYFENYGIRKVVLLSRYADLMINWAFDERKGFDERIIVSTPSFSEDGIYVPEYIFVELGKWERQSIPLQVSDEYKQVILEFVEYFKSEFNEIKDPDLMQEVKLMEILV